MSLPVQKGQSQHTGNVQRSASVATNATLHEHIPKLEEEPSAALEKQSVENISSFFGVLTRPLEWVQSGVSLVKKAVGFYYSTDLTLGRVTELLRETGISDYQTAYSLFQDYAKFKAEKSQGAMTHQGGLREVEKRALDLYNRRGKLTPVEKVEFKQLLERLCKEQEQKRETMFHNAKVLLERIDIPNLQDASRPVIQEAVASTLKDLKGSTDLTIDDYSLIELVVSKVLLIGMDDKAPGPQKVAFLAATYQEHNRLKPLSESFTGEDFLRVKVEQLQFLFADLENFSWTLTFVEDEPKGGSPRTIEVMKQMVQDDPQLRQVASQIEFLDYDALQGEISAYKDPELAQMDGDTFARSSVKGGAIQVGLRYLAQVQGGQPKADFIFYTDCDTSVNLGNSGILLNQVINQGKDIAIGSRRIEGAHVIGKSAERHLQSFLFNTLVRVLLNVQVTDTQVGAKVFRPEVIRGVHGEFSELSMAFDPEILRLANKAGFSIGEDGIVWTDSAIESKSADQSGNMLQGLLRIWQRSFPAPTEKDAPPMGSIEEFHQKGRSLAEEGKLFDSLMSLATNPKWNLIVKHLDDIYLGVAPRDFKNFIHAFTTFLVKLANNDLKKEDIQTVIQQLIAVKENLHESDALAFFFHEFPEVMDVIELLNKDPHYARVIVPLLIGKNPVTQLISKHGHVSFHEFAKQTGIQGTPQETFLAWVEAGQTVQTETVKKTREELPLNLERIGKGISEVRAINEELKAKGETRKISLVVQYNMDNTSPDYIRHALISKMDALRKELGDCKNIHWEFVVVDAREKRETPIDETFTRMLAEASDERVSGRHITLEGQTGKAAAVRFGMSKAADAGSDYVGFIDFSDKIHILEMTHLLHEAYTAEDKGGIAIGSRRLEASEVENKPIPYLIRSMGLNFVVKAMFPHLFNISDTQTGFKLFKASSWQQISDSGLKNDSLAFDIEILQQAARLGLPIAECPVDFRDSTQNIEDFGEEMVGSLFDEVIKIRATTKDTPLTEQKEGEARLIGGGAENVVYRLSNGSIIKIPHEASDPEFVGFLKHVLFKGQKEMKLDDQQDKLVTSQFINRLLTSPRFSKYVPALRSWADLNIFVMKLITSFENKAYKSMGYETAQRLGKDLVIPFRFVEESFTVEVDGAPKTFTPEDNVKQSVFANAVFKDRVMEAIQRKDARAVKELLGEGVHLFEDLWKRGLFDLDTNFLCDTGYYPDSQGKERLMVLDPGELIDDLSRIDIDTARNQVEKRYDYIELEILLREHFPEAKDEILAHYKDQMYAFLDDIDKGGSKRDQFGIDQQDQEDFRVPFDESLELPWVEAPGKTKSQTQREAYRMSAVGYQHAFQEGMPTLTEQTSSFPYQHVVPKGAEKDKELGVDMGSIGPLVPALEQTLTHPNTDLLLLDAGSATRASIIKYGEETGTKGSIEVSGRPLYEHAAVGLQEFAADYLPEGYVILASADDVLEINAAQAEKMRAHLQEGVGAYWCDLPNAGKEFIPLTRGLTIDFFRKHASLPELSSNFLRSVPVTKGFVDSMGTETLFEGLSQAIPEQETTQTASTQQQSPGGIPGVSVLTDTYAQFLQFNAAQKLGGMKTPFLLILKKEFVQDFLQEIAPLLPNYTWNDITWENILVRGMKADKEMWMMSGKPPLMDKAAWGEIYDRLQALKAKHGINTDDPTQNEARVFRGNWQNFDDPYALFRFAAASYAPEGTFHSDNQTPPPSIASPIPTNFVALKSNLEGKVRIIPPEGVLRGVTSENLFYNVNLPKGETLSVHAGHAVVQIDGELYSIHMGPMTKDDLKKAMVYKYDHGEPRPYMTYSNFMKERSSI